MKPRMSIVLKVLLALVVIVAITFIATINNPANLNEDTEIVAKQTATPTAKPTLAPTLKPTLKPSPTSIPAYIPSPAELKEVDLAQLNLRLGLLKYTINSDSLSAQWEINEAADYNVLYALDGNNVVYSKEILWPDIDSWTISNIRRGSILLMSFEDMGKKGTDDDVLLGAQYQKISDQDVILNAALLQNKYYIIIDKEDYTMAVFTYDESGEYTKLVASFPCAVGRSARMTALGVFEISSKGLWKRWNSTQYSPYYTKYTSGVYIHGPIYRRKTFDTLQSKSYEAIGTSATSGCIRSTLEGAKFIYFECPAGTIVEVVLSSDLVSPIEKIPLDQNYPKWDPTDPDKPIGLPSPSPSGE